MLPSLSFLLLTYLLAAVPFGVVVTTMFGGDVDIRHSGSGNIGATNVARVYGWSLAGWVVALDMLKGTVPVLLAGWLWPGRGVWWPGLVLLVSFTAHCYPVYLEFKGGKGVATAAGGLLAISPWVALPVVAVWIGLLGLSGRSSVAALGSAVSLIVVAAWLDPSVTWIAALLGLGILTTHVPNVRRLVRGEENTVVRPVRWGRAAANADPGLRLRQGPGGGPPLAIWKEHGAEE